MKNYARLLVMTFLAAVLAISACDAGDKDNDNSTLLMLLGGGKKTDVVFQGAVQTGGTSGTADSTGLTLTFDVDPTTLTADDITLYGATRGELTGSGTTRSLSITNLTVINGASVYIAISSPSGYSISGSTRMAVIYRAPLIVTFQGAVQTGGVSCTADSTALTLTFSSDPTTLFADDITLTGATKGALTGSGTTRSLAISDITVSSGKTVSVTITSPYGYSMSGSPVTAVVYKNGFVVGAAYGGGIIAYIFQSGDTGYVEGETHGLIAATADQSAGIQWGSCPGFALSKDFGTGSANTDSIIAANGSATDYAAYVARAYNGGGYTDWYLPSSGELYKLYPNQATIGGFDSGCIYWSSSMLYNSASLYGPTYPYYVDMRTGDPYSTASYYSYRVRAVRNF